MTEETRKSKEHSKQSPVLLTRKEVSELLRISLTTLNLLTKRGDFTAYRCGGKLLYNQDEVLRSLRSTSKIKQVIV